MHILENTSYLLVSNGVVNVVRAEVRHKRQLPWRKKQDRDEKEIFRKQCGSCTVQRKRSVWVKKGTGP